MKVLVTHLMLTQLLVPATVNNLVEEVFFLGFSAHERMQCMCVCVPSFKTELEVHTVVKLGFSTSNTMDTFHTV